MKKLTILIYLLMSINAFAQEEHLAKVYVVNGVEAYILNEPIRAYKVVYGQGQGISWSSFVTVGLINSSVSAKVGKLIKGVIKKAEEEGKDIDAVIYTSGKNITAVKFTDEPTPETKQIAIIHRLNGIPTYVMCEPKKDFRAIKNKGGGIKWKSALTVGLVNNSIEQDLMKFAKKYKRMFTKKKIDALHYTSGKKCDGIAYD